MKYKTSEAHRRASKKYRQENKETERINTYRRTARLFINKHSDIPDLFQLQELLNQRFLSLIEEATPQEKEALFNEYLSRQEKWLEKEKEREKNDCY
ncbi:TPA: hypothetical protein ITS48_002363 [Enterococcus faecalis]|uniref:hypothetical protein n=1 Tax=Enterococcus faecalis TaxID=1351 RepID=UPI0002D7B909|nr:MULTISPECIES: hypothetical protein [Bacteria]SJN49470.1 hypothetical protein FM120_23490 [Sphingobacterium faecium PCAi_F2.5]EGO8428519.1 hypothetical protein [Enterococcus faecalis]EOF35086.1 hypothetical protein SCK_00981 [Enterococcus faecalis EnGen0103]EOF35252.1 hypothetical protein SCG_00977 [Enterococcus faecalis EnGen0102]EOF41395.1 hypothetical protein SCM_00970 [Enterococcus faecalis EnGen0104]